MIVTPINRDYTGRWYTYKLFKTFNNFGIITSSELIVAARRLSFFDRIKPLWENRI